MPNIKLIALDVDDTLVATGTDKISAENKDAIFAAQKSGIKVTIATGRIYTHVKRLISELNIDTPIVTLNGADIRCKDNVLKRSVIPMSAVRDLIATTQKFPRIARMIFSGEGVYAECTPQNREIIQKMKNTIVDENSLFLLFDDFKNVYPLVSGDVRKILLWANDKEEFNALKNEIINCSAECELTNSGGFNIELNTKGVTKDNALSYVAEYLKLPMECVLSIGDSGNDIAMLKKSGIGVAVANASPDALKTADYITDSCKENGVAKAIYKYAIGKTL